MGALKLQMSWQPSYSLLSQKRKTGPPLGLRNLGNSCYLNSVLQCLTYTPPLAYFCLSFQHSSLCDSAADPNRKRNCPFCILEKRIARSLRLDSTLDAPAKIQSSLRLYAEHFRCGHQEDAHEFLLSVIDACHNTCLRLKKLRCEGSDPISGSTIVKEIFGGALQSQVKCLSCGAESNKIDEIMDISLDILHSSSLKEAMQKFFQAEILDGNNKYKCEKCKKLVAAKKQMSIYQAPNVLVIQLKRFEGIYGGKIDKAIAFEAALGLSSFMCKGSQDSQPEYKLFGTIVHSGYSQDSGHYYAYIKDVMDRWYCCNDSFVRLSSLQEVLSEKVYILFFSRASQRPPSVTTPLCSNGADPHDCNGTGTSNGSKASNGVSSHGCNGTGASNVSKASNGVSSHGCNGTGASNVSKASNGVHSHDCYGSGASNGSKAALKLFKSVHAKTDVGQSSRSDISCASRLNNRPSSPRIKFNISGSSTSKRVPSIANGSADVHKSQNGDTKDLVHSEKISIDSVPSLHSNGVTNKKVDAVSETDRVTSAFSRNGIVQSAGLNNVKANLQSDGGRGSIRRNPKHSDLLNGDTYCSTEISGSKRKLEDSCILLAQDALSRTKVEELKRSLEKETKSVLKSCGWTDKVESFMHSKKRMYMEQMGSMPSNRDESKKLLIGNAKRPFIAQIPETLKENLIESLRSFGQGKFE